MKRIALFILTLAVLFTLSGCGDKGDTHTCYLSVTMTEILDHMDELTQVKRALIPSDGVLLSRTQTTFTNGETAFDVLRRVLMEKKIHFEYSGSAAARTVYIEGIGNIYEFDLGPLSGWVFTRNGESLSVGCSVNALSEGDDIVFSYTVDGVEG